MDGKGKKNQIQKVPHKKDSLVERLKKARPYVWDEKEPKPDKPFLLKDVKTRRGL